MYVIVILYNLLIIQVKISYDGWPLRSIFKSLFSMKINPAGLSDAPYSYPKNCWLHEGVVGHP
jgi:hypothetical protein